QAIELVEAEVHRIYADHERDLGVLADEIARQNILVGATTAAARTVLISDYLTAKSGGYPPPKRFMALLMLRPQLKPHKTQAAKAEALPLD
ncbi:hypothetical protein ACWCQL_30935, partial [Streptomyces sp. NPDC002073]